LVRQLEERGWSVAGFDLGGTLKNNRRQGQIKFETLLAALKDMHYAALALGPEELRFGPDYLLAQNFAAADDPAQNLELLAANVVFYGDPQLGTPVRSKLLTVNGVNIGVVAVLGESLKDLLLINDDAVIRVDPPQQVLPQVIAELEAQQPDLIVLLSHAPLEESRKFAESNPQIDLVLSAGGPEDPDDKPLEAGNAMLVQVGKKGKYVGVVAFYPDQTPQLRYELVNLDNRRFKEAPAMREYMRQYQTALHDELLAEREPPIDHPTGWTFVGVEKCGECHKKAYAKWQDPGDRDYFHAHAYESLKHGRKGQEKDWITRIHDPECLACHVTGWDPEGFLRYDSGFESEEKSPHLIAQQCENCHGPGSEHVRLEELFKSDRKQVQKSEYEAARKAMKRSIETAETQVCAQCHDLDNSPHFKFKEYWEKIKHPWRD
jgi:hypothetical protein